MNTMLRNFAAAGVAMLAGAAQAQSTPGNAPTVLLPYGVSTVAKVHTALAGPIVTMPVREGVPSAPTPDSVPAASAASTTVQPAPAPAN
jgi:hypothetical protein